MTVLNINEFERIASFMSKRTKENIIYAMSKSNVGKVQLNLKTGVVEPVIK
ncbi:hypothetical protein N9R79_11920 [Vibrio sp.]|nr:hypothetical protein [Vibrio sp.]